MADQPEFTDAEILAARPPRNALDPWRPYAWLVEDERAASGSVDPVATVFLTNRECSFRCLMCDLWRNTLATPTPRGAIPEQIRFALQQLPPATHIKLYNAGNFFDRRAIPVEDHAEIGRLVSGFRTVIVENHPRLCDDRCVEFQELLAGQLEVAMGLETVHPGVLPQLNKRMTLDDFRRAAEFLVSHDIALRAFVLLRPPYLDEAEGLEWALRSLEFALDQGAGIVALIATRANNGIMERLAAAGQFSPPSLRSLEIALETGIGWGRGRVVADLWEIERLATCAACGPARRQRMAAMNLQQQVLPAVQCAVCRP